MTNQTLVADSKQRVALEMAVRILVAEQENDVRLKIDREYFLTLYCQCYKAASGDDLGEVLKKD